MSKGIKFSDVAHLYVGNKVKIKDGGVCLLDSVSGSWLCNVKDPLSVDSGQYVSIDEISPILRPFSDMTPDEALEICKFACPLHYGDYRFNKWEVRLDPKFDKNWMAYELTNKADKGAVFVVDLIDGDIMVYDRDEADYMSINKNYLFEYLKMGFDCHELIKQGQALDKTKFLTQN